MVNFCTNCGAKLRRDANFCTNCGAKVVQSDMGQHNTSSNPYFDNMEKEVAKEQLKRVVGGKLVFNKSFYNVLLENGLGISTGMAIRKQVEKEIDSGQIRVGDVQIRVNQLIIEYQIKNEETKKKLRMINEIFESEEIKLEIINNNIDRKHVISIKDNLKNKIIDKNENMSEEEIKHFIKTELEKVIKQEKARIAKEKEEARKAKEREEARKAEREERRRRELEWIEKYGGGYCSLSCRHCYEEFFDSGGGIVGDFDVGGYSEYYCNIGYSVSFGSFCKDYE